MSLTNVFGLHADALLLREKRAEILANNISSSSVPGFKARDFDFHQVLAQQSNAQTTAAPLTQTNEKHFNLVATGSINGQLSYRIPYQASLDGNTVDQNLEYQQFIDNAMHYQVSLSFISSKMRKLTQAMQGDV